MSSKRTMSYTLPPMSTASELANKYNLTKDDLSGKVTHDFMVQLNMHISKWREIAPHLGLEPAERENILEDGKSNQERRLLMLEKWGAKFGEEASFFNLIQRLLSANRRDIAETVCKFFIQKIKVQQKQTDENHTSSSSSLTAQLNDQEELPTNEETIATEGIQLRDQSTTRDKQENNEQDENNQDENDQDENEQDKIPMSAKICCCCSISTLCCLLLFVTPVILIAVGSTIFRQNTPPPATVTILLDDVLLLGEFNSFHVGGVLFRSISGNAHLYRVPCQDLIALNRTLELSVLLNVTEQVETYAINMRHFPQDTTLEYKFEYQLRNTTSTLDCPAFLYIFESVGFYDSFLEHGTRTGFTYSQCAQNGSSINRTVLVSHDSYTGLYIPQMSAIESVEIGFTGRLVTYDISEYQPNCIVSALQESCTVKLESQGYRSSKKTCILASTPNNASQVYYQPLANPETTGTQLILILVGIGVGMFLLILLISIIFSTRRKKPGHGSTDKIICACTY